MKKKATNLLLLAAFFGCAAWVAVAPRLQALIPLVLGIIVAEIYVSINHTDNVKSY